MPAATTTLRGHAATLVLTAAAALCSAPALAAFDARLIGGSTASFSSNIAGQSVFDNHRFAFDDRSTDLGLSRLSLSSAGGDFNFANNFNTRCVRNDGTTPCNGSEGPGESGLLYTTPADYIRRGVGPATARAQGTADNGVLRATAVAADNGRSLTDSSPVPGNASLLYSRPINPTGASAQVTADLLFSKRMGGTAAPGTVGLAVVTGHVDGGIAGNDTLVSDVRDASNSFEAGSAGARFSVSVTDYQGINCTLSLSSSVSCPAQNFSATWGSESAVGAATRLNGNYGASFSLIVHVTPGFLLQTRMTLDVSARGEGSASFGNTAQIDSITLPDGFAFDTSDGSLLRSGNVYSLVPTLAAVPEPGTAALALVGGLVGGLLLAGRLRRRRAR